MSDVDKPEVQAKELVMEIVELENGDLALRFADQASDEQPVLRVGVSEALRENMQERFVDIAKVMLTAGVQMMAEAGFVGNEPEAEVRPTIH